jgi:hypothetical protein
MVQLQRQIGITCRLIVFAFVLVVGVFGISLAASDNDTLIAMGLCQDMDYYINSVADFTETKCIPVPNDRGSNFIFVSLKPVFSVKASEKAWVLVVSLSFGREFNKKADYKVGSLYLADMTMVPNLSYSVLSGELAKKLQKQVYDGQIEPDAAWESIVSAMKSYKGEPLKR